MSDRMKFIKLVAENLIDKGITTLEGDYEYHAAMAWIETITQTRYLEHKGFHRAYEAFLIYKSADADFANLLFGLGEPKDFLESFYSACCVQESDKRVLSNLVFVHHLKMHESNDTMRTEESEHKYFDDKYDR